MQCSSIWNSELLPELKTMGRLFYRGLSRKLAIKANFVKNEHSSEKTVLFNAAYLAIA